MPQNQPLRDYFDASEASAGMNHPGAKAVATDVVDMVIVGGGCAGLSLAREIYKQGFQGTVTVLEPRHHYEDDRSWCFWAGDDHPLIGLVCHSWPQWLFGLAAQPASPCSSAGFAYRYIRSSDFYANSVALIEASPNTTLLTGHRLTSLSQDGVGWCLGVQDDGTGASHTLHAKHVIDTRPPAEAQRSRSKLFQCFMGIEIELAFDQWDDQQAELMTDMRLVDGEFCFTYILPLSARVALVEVTYFARYRVSPSDIQRELDDVLSRRGWSSARHMRRESGALPMGMPLNETPSPAGLVQAGIGGGALRASSGYGFLRIQRWAAICAQRLVQGHGPCGHAEPSRMLYEMDHLFLDVLVRQPTLGPDLFRRLFGQLEPSRLVRFMTDRPSGIDLMALVACLPKTPFLQALRRRLMKGRP
jgi:lycopene beta-cyclase